jgi:hypothetical protein
MDKQEFLDRTVMGGVLEDDRELLLSAIESGDYKSLEDLLLTQLQVRTSQLINYHNQNISQSISELVRFKQWTNLLQIFRCLPDDVVQASRDDVFRETWESWAKTIKKFNGLSADQRELALELLDNHLKQEGK